MNTKINYTKEGGRYYRAHIFFIFTVVVVAMPLLVLLLIGLLNPFWFRDSYLIWLQSTIEGLARWRNYRMYKIYLGIDPKVWHALKDDDSTKVGREP